MRRRETGNDGLGIGRGDGKQSISVLASIIYSTTAGIEAVGFAATATLSGTSGADSFGLRGFASFGVGQTITLLAGNDRFLGGADGLAVPTGLRCRAGMAMTRWLRAATGMRFTAMQGMTR
ncbi:MAG: hypothetical protein H7245_17990 [Candidatus Saccharibacteria bacterium]|nr:hypothetical protein [Pseudorhodobacter sp.]